MKRCLCGLVILGCFALLFFWATFAEADFTIMPLGASITSGSGGTNGGYRDRLYSDLHDAGLSFTFVGSSTENPSRLLTQTSQTHHEGHPGYRIDQVANNLDGNDGSSGNNGGFWFRKPSPPNIILLEAGRNDIAQNFQTSTMAQRMDKLVGQIFADSPTSILLLSSSVPTGFSRAMNQLLQAYNTQIRDDIVPKYQSLGDNVIFVDQYANFVDSNGNIIHVSPFDNYHPDTTGYNLMADTWAAALLRVAPVPEPSSLVLLGIGSSISVLGCVWRRRRSGRRNCPRPLFSGLCAITPAASTRSKGASEMYHSSKSCFHLTIGSLFIVLSLAIAPARAQNLFVANQGGNTISEFSPGGANLGPFATTGLLGPTALAFDASGNLFVSNFSGGSPDGTIREFSPSGTDLGNFATGLKGPRGLAFDKSGNLYVATDDNRIQEFSPTGANLGNFATTGLSTPRGLAFDKNGNLYAGNFGDNTIRKFSPTGVDLGNFTTTGVAGVALIAFDKSDNLYVTNMAINANAIRKFSPTGVDLGDFASKGLNQPAGLAFDTAGNLYVSNRADSTIREFSPTGEDLGYFATTGMDAPVGLAFSAAPVPEPATLLLLGIGSIGLLGFAWQRAGEIRLRI